MSLISEYSVTKTNLYPSTAAFLFPTAQTNSLWLIQVVELCLIPPHVFLIVWGFFQFRSWRDVFILKQRWVKFRSGNIQGEGKGWLGIKVKYLRMMLRRAEQLFTLSSFTEPFSVTSVKQRYKPPEEWELPVSGFDLSSLFIVALTPQVCDCLCEPAV